ncbi:MAG: hypothetical protein H8E66_19575 [Planctomycetes bacterium]|nr:hypothetical protein [Planctomycetota bacterium]
MKTPSILAFVVLCLLGGWFVSADEAEVHEKRASNSKRKSPVETVVFSVRNGPADQLAATLRELYDDPNMRFLPEPISNLLLIRVESDRRDEIIELLGELDRAQHTVIVHAYLLRANGDALSSDEAATLTGSASQVTSQIERLRGAGRIVLLNKMKLAALEQQRAILQTGEDIPLVTGASFSPSRGRTSSYQHRSIGTLLSVTARTSPDDQITLEVQFDKSAVSPSVGDADDADQAPDSVTQLTLQTTLQLESGAAALSGAIVHESSADSTHAYLVVSATIADTNSKPNAMPNRVSRETTRSSSSGRSSGQGGPIPEERLDSLVRGVFARADQNQDGVLAGDELSSPGVDGKRADSDQDGKVTPEEYKQFVMTRFSSSSSSGTSVRRRPSSSAGTRPEEIDKRYLQYATLVIKKYDADKDGTLDEDELESANRDYASADKNGDGVVAASELAEWMKNK